MTVGELKKALENFDDNLEVERTIHIMGETLYVSVEKLRIEASADVQGKEIVAVY